MRAVVTGASGFIGYALTEFIANEWGRQSVQAVVGPVQHERERQRLNLLQRHGITVISSDLRQSPVFHGRVEDFDVFFHLAAYTRTEEASPDIRINDLGTERMLNELGSGLRGKRLIYTSSICAVDNPPGGGQMNDQTPCRPRMEYGVTKRAGETIVKAAASEMGFEYTILRLPTTYGPGFRPGGMFDILARTAPRNAISSRIQWPGKLAIVQVNDLARILTQTSLHAEMKDRVFYVSSGEDPTMGEMASETAKCLGVQFRPILLPQWVQYCLRILRSPLWQNRILPHRFKVAAWRGSLVLDGFYCDGSEVTRLLDFQYQAWKNAFARMYAAHEEQNIEP